MQLSLQWCCKAEPARGARVAVIMSSSSGWILTCICCRGMCVCTYMAYPVCILEYPAQPMMAVQALHPCWWSAIIWCCQVPSCFCSQKS